MPAIAHIGIGFAAKKAVPNIKVIYLLIAAELIEIVFFVLVAAGIEKMPQADKPPFSPYSHSIIMGVIWSIVAALFTTKNHSFIDGNKRIAAILFLYVLP